MPKKLNDKQVSELVIEHANGTSISALARKYGLARNTVKSYIASKADFEQKLTAIKNETVTEWLNSRRGQIQGLLDRILALLTGQDRRRKPERPCWCL